MVLAPILLNYEIRPVLISINFVQIMSDFRRNSAFLAFLKPFLKMAYSVTANPIIASGMRATTHSYMRINAYFNNSNLVISFFRNYMHASIFVEKAIVADPKLRSASSEVPALPLRKRRVLVADDHAIFRECLIRLLQDCSGIDVVGNAEDGLKAVELAEILKPDVIIMDVDMPRISGTEAARQIAARLPQVRILALSMHETKGIASQMISAGAAGYFVKDGPVEDLLSAILS
jgi:CheY-like chemotaxis protein